MRFTVERRDIENGQPNDPCNCAAARALKRQADAKEVFVFRDVTYIVRKDGHAFRFHTTPALRLETIVYDRQGAFHPGAYDIDPAPLAASRSTKKKTASSSSPSRRNSSKTRHGIPNVRPTASQRLPRV
jgi:hypothetical protein